MLEEQGITVNSWHIMRSSSPQHHDWLSHSPASCTMRTEGTFPGWFVKITTHLDLMPSSWETKPQLCHMSPYHDTKLSKGTITFKGSHTPKRRDVFHLTARAHPSLYSGGHAQGRVQIKSAYCSYIQKDCLGK